MRFEIVIPVIVILVVGTGLGAARLSESLAECAPRLMTGRGAFCFMG